jgi:hypothetical protein
VDKAGEIYAPPHKHAEILKHKIKVIKLTGLIDMFGNLPCTVRENKYIVQVEV